MFSYHRVFSDDLCDLLLQVSFEVYPIEPKKNGTRRGSSKNLVKRMFFADNDFFKRWFSFSWPMCHISQARFYFKYSIENTLEVLFFRLLHIKKQLIYRF